MTFFFRENCISLDLKIWLNNFAGEVHVLIYALEFLHAVLGSLLNVFEFFKKGISKLKLYSSSRFR